MQSLTKVEAAKELLWLDRAASSVLNFAGSVDIPGQPLVDEGDPDDELYDPKCEKFTPITTGLASHHILLLKELDKVLDYIAWKHFGDEEAAKRINYETHDRTLVFMPPGSAKSTYASVVTPAYAMGRLQGLKVLLTSYGTGIAKKQGRKGRALCKNPDFQRIFETELSKESFAADEWSLTNGSEYMSGGILSGLTGNRSHLNIFDDPVKGRKEADSPTVQESTYDAYQEDFMTRLLPNGAVFGIQTRWNENDLSGKILPDEWDGESGHIKCKDGKVWNVICLPAIANRKDDLLGRDIGETLWPEWFSKEHFAPFMKNKRTWNALFQQSPTADDGDFFKREWFNKRWDSLPAELEYYIGADYAATEDDGDYTEIGVFGVDANRHVYVVDWFSGQVTSKEWLRELFHFAKKYKVNWHAAEPGIIRRMSEATIKDTMVEQSIYFGLNWIGGGNSKEANAYSFRNLCEHGRVYWPRDNDITERVINQLLKAFGGRYDDAIDACSCFGLEITKAWQASPPKKEVKPVKPNNKIPARSFRNRKPVEESIW